MCIKFVLKAVVAIIIAFPATCVAEALSEFANGNDDYQTHEPTRDGHSKLPSRRWAEAVGNRVQAEGIAWGSFEKTFFGQYVILDDAKIYVHKDDFRNKKLDGRMVRVVGTLRRETVKFKPDGRSVQTVEMFVIHPESIVEVKQIEWPWLWEPDRK